MSVETANIHYLPAVLVDTYGLTVNPQVARIAFGDSGGTGNPEGAVPRVAIAMPTEALRSLHATLTEVLGRLDGGTVQRQEPLGAKH